MANTKNAQIEGFLRYYLALDRAPQYAVMVRGQWGSGKTFFMERQLERYREDGGKALYVSLYGMTSVKEIEEEFFRQLHPVLASKGMAVAGKVARGRRCQKSCVPGSVKRSQLIAFVKRSPNRMAN